MALNWRLMWAPLLVMFIMMIIFYTSRYAPGFTVTRYEIAVEIQDKSATFTFPPFKVSSTTKNGRSAVAGCIYYGTLITQKDAILLLEGKTVCVSPQGTSYSDMPLFTFNPNGGEVSITLGNEENGTWTYSVRIKVLDAG